MLALFKPILFTFLKSKAIRQLALDLVRACVTKTDNDVDDKLCDMLEQALFPGRRTTKNFSIFLLVNHLLKLN